MSSRHMNGLASTFIVQVQHTTTSVPLGCLEPVEWMVEWNTGIECWNGVNCVKNMVLKTLLDFLFQCSIP